MKTNPLVKRVVFYGDSLVYGKVPGQNRQYPCDVRFTGVLQKLLGDEYDIIEAGLRARNMSGENPYFADRDGLKTFSPVMGSLLPADVIVLFLGTNDTNNKPDFDAEKVAGSLVRYQEIVKEWSDFLDCPLPKLAAVVPPLVNEAAFDDLMQKIFAGAGLKIEPLRRAIIKIATDLQLPVYDAASVVQPDDGDGIHLSPDANAALARAMEGFIRSV